MTRLVSPFIVALLVVWALPAPALAQPAEQAETTQAREGTLDLTVDLFGAVDRAFGSGDQELVTSRERTYWGGNSALTFDRRSTRFSVSANAAASVRRLSDVTDGLLPSYTGSLGLTGELSPRTSWSLTQGLSWGPANAAGLMGPGDLVTGVQGVPQVDYRLSNESQFTTGTRGSLTRNLSRRGALSVSFGYDRSTVPESTTAETPEEVPEPIGSRAFQRWESNVRYTHRTTRYASWYAGYGLTRNLVGDETIITTDPQSHAIDLGVLYARPLSFSRRTRISTQVGSTMLTTRLSGERRWRINGAASLQHEIGRTWLAELAFTRDTQYLAAFADAVNNNAITASLAGTLATRSSVALLANRTSGRVGIDADAGGYDLTSVSATYRYAFLRQLAAYFQYFLFDSNFDRTLAVSGGSVVAAQRHGVRFGISFGTGLWGNRRTLGLPLSGDSSR